MGGAAFESRKKKWKPPLPLPIPDWDEISPSLSRAGIGTYSLNVKVQKEGRGLEGWEGELSSHLLYKLEEEEEGSGRRALPARDRLAAGFRFRRRCCAAVDLSLPGGGVKAGGVGPVWNSSPYSHGHPDM
jgi:hypothetical protein